MFHGKSAPYHKSLFFKWYQYILVFLLCSAWATLIPFSRYLLGAHSLDQIVFGITIGFVNAIILHFFIRDHFITHIERSQEEQGLGEESRLIYLRKVKAEKFQFHASKNYSSMIYFHPAKYAIPLVILFGIYCGVSCWLFTKVDARLIGSDELAQWISNYSKAKCKNFDISKSLQNASLVGCGYPAFPVFGYVFTLYRNKIVGTCK